LKWPAVNLDLPENKGLNPWVVWTRDIVTQKNNCLNLVVTGQPGKGKSWALLSFFHLLSEAMGKEFDLERSFSFRAVDFMRKVNQESFTEPGTILGLDEAGIDLHNLKYYDEMNKGLNSFLQTGRHRNYVFGLTVPYLPFLSKGVRIMMLAEWEALGWTSKNKTIIQPRHLQYNSRQDMIYRKRLMVIKDGRLQYCNKIELPKPPKKVIVEYESLKKQFTSDLFDDIVERMEGQIDKQKASVNRGRALTLKQEKILNGLKDGLLVPTIAKREGITERAVYNHMQLIQKKGISIRAVKEEGGSAVGYEVKGD